MNNILNYYWTDTPSYEGIISQLPASSRWAAGEVAKMMPGWWRFHSEILQVHLNSAHPRSEKYKSPHFAFIALCSFLFLPPRGRTSKFQTVCSRLKLQDLFGLHGIFKEAVRSQFHGDSSFGRGPRTSLDSSELGYGTIVKAVHIALVVCSSNDGPIL